MISFTPIFASMLMITTVQTASIWNVGIKTAAAQNMVAIGFIEKAFGRTITWLEWLIAAAPFGVAMSTMADEYDTMDVRKAAINVHARIADAIEAQNADLAFRRMEKHVSATRAVTSAREDRELGT